jgi:hypothetical protein
MFNLTFVAINFQENSCTMYIVDLIETMSEWFEM